MIYSQMKYHDISKILKYCPALVVFKPKLLTYNTISYVAAFLNALPPYETLLKLKRSVLLAMYNKQKGIYH